MKKKYWIIIFIVGIIFVFPPKVKAEEPILAGWNLYLLDISKNEEPEWKVEYIDLEVATDPEKIAYNVFSAYFTGGFSGFVPEDTKLLQVYFDLGHLYLNVSREILAYGGGGLQEYCLREEILLNAATIPGVEFVTLLIEGEMVLFPEGTEVIGVAVAGIVV